MNEGITLLKRTQATRKHKHFSQKTIETISQCDLQQFLTWYDDCVFSYDNNRFTLSCDEEIVVYPNLGYNHYTGETYPPVVLLIEKIGLTYPDALYLLNYFYYKVKKEPLRKLLDSTTNQSFPLRRAAGSNPTLSLEGILEENLFLHQDTKAAAYRRAIAYLCDRRHIDKDWVLHFIKQGFLKMDKQNNLCFLAYENPLHKENVIAIAKKGTTDKRFCPNFVKEHGEGFFYARKEYLETQSYGQLYLFESAVDLLSFLTLQSSGRLEMKDHDANCCYAAMNGAGNTGFLDKLLSRYPTIQRVTLCLDNDSKGIKAAEEITAQYQGRCEMGNAHPVLLAASLAHGYQKDFNSLLSIAGIDRIATL